MLNKLERKFGKYAIHNLMLYVIAGYGIGYLLILGSRITTVNFASLMLLDPGEIIFHFQLWRLVSWILIPPSSNFLSFLILCVLYYQLGSALENYWGAFRFNLFIFGGFFFTLVGAFIVYVIELFFAPVSLGVYYVNSYYVCLSIFLAFAMCFPDNQILLYFIIPVKMKWMAIVYVVLVGYDVISPLIRLYPKIVALEKGIVVLASFLNCVIFYLITHKKSGHRTYFSWKKESVNRGFSSNTDRGYRNSSTISRHKCAVCGRTELTNPELEFRFCSKCNGNYEYCSEHLFTHQHVR